MGGPLHGAHRTKALAEIKQTFPRKNKKKSAPGFPGADAGLSLRKRPFYLPKAAWAAASRAIGTR
ncbi:MAG TPA: hypothetical protein DCM68_05835 [Verrucomicrobia bacterium]|nr:hypothetical protein [Verrucomicrobiota bacterium]